MQTVTHDDGRIWFFAAVLCLSVYLHDISKTDAARITKLDVEMFHDEFWKLVYFGFKRSNVKVMNHKKHC